MLADAPVVLTHEAKKASVEKKLTQDLCSTSNLYSDGLQPNSNGLLLVTETDSMATMERPLFQLKIM